MKKFLIYIALTIFATNVSAQSKQEKLIRGILEVQTNAWNNGNIEEFMNGYWKSDSLMFIGKSGVTYGWQNTLNHYKKSYPDTATMGHLTFNILEVKRLSAIYYNVVGKWSLQRSIGNLSGHYTLLWRRVKSGWVIVQDHSS